MQNNLFEDAEAFIREFFSGHTDGNYHYHNLNHTRDIVKYSREIGEGVGLSEEELQIVTIAAWFHDAGYPKNSEGHEAIGASLARQFLQKKNMPEHFISQVEQAIHATRLGTEPETEMERVICDADLLHVAKDTFQQSNRLLRKEWELTKNRFFSDREWLEAQVEFLSQHRFYTPFAKEKYAAGKLQNLEKIKSALRKLGKGNKGT